MLHSTGAESAQHAEISWKGGRTSSSLMRRHSTQQNIILAALWSLPCHQHCFDHFFSQRSVTVELLRDWSAVQLKSNWGKSEVGYLINDRPQKYSWYKTTIKQMIKSEGQASDHSRPFVCPVMAGRPCDLDRRLLARLATDRQASKHGWHRQPGRDLPLIHSKS